MNIKQIMENINVEKIMRVIALNEISGNENVICKFSYAGGKSGYSFGRSQFDVTHNARARNFLKNICGFSNQDMEKLLNLDKDINHLNERLKLFRVDIDKLDREHIQQMVNYVASLEGMPEFENEKTFVHLVDYHNQFNISKNGLMHRFIKSKKIITSQNILNFKLRETKWGREQPRDVKRRYNNIESNWK